MGLGCGKVGCNGGGLGRDSVQLGAIRHAGPRWGVMCVKVQLAVMGFGSACWVAVGGNGVQCAGAACGRLWCGGL